MAIILGQGGAEDYEVERAVTHRLVDSFAAYGRLYLMACFLDGDRLGYKHLGVALTVKNLKLK
jgi:hypothetical protein